MIILKEFPQKRLFKHRFISPLTHIKKSQVERNRSYQKSLKISAILSLFLFLIFFNGLPKQFNVDSKILDVDTVDLVIEEIPRTEQLDRPPPPARPAVPIPTEDVDVPEDLTIEGTEINFSELPPPPPPQESKEQGYRFIPYDSPPMPIGGFASLLKYIKYPEIARRAGVECQVIVGVLVSVEGKSVKTVILKDSGAQLGFEEAAQYAVKQLRWKPAQQRDNPIKVWVSVPVTFQLN